MPYIYSNNGFSIRWEDETYSVKDGETASDVFIAPPEPSSKQSAQQSSEQTGSLPRAPEPSIDVRLEIVEARLAQFLKIAAGITSTLLEQ